MRDVIMFIALFTIFGIAKGRLDRIDSLEVALSIFTGSMTFWIAVSHAIRTIRNKIEDPVFNGIPRISAFAITVFGIIILLYCI